MTELESHSYLVFRIHGELYASPLLEFSEVVGFIEPKPVPNMPDYFSGMINLRGVIVGVVDLRKKMGINDTFTGKQTMLICETESGIMGASIDKIESVIHIDPATIQDVKLSTRVSADYLQGFINHHEEIITLIDVKNFISDIQKQNITKVA